MEPNLQATDSQEPTEEHVRSQLEAVTRELEELKRRQEDLTRGWGLQLYFQGKDEALRTADQVKPHLLEPVPELSVLPGSDDFHSPNLLIEGENLQTMKSLYKYKGKVDLILTDPPYNVGKDFRYNDKWEVDPNDEDLGKFVAEDDLAKHTKWCRFMLPRLQVMHEMLAPTGVIAICIGQQELFRLGQLMDEVFRDENRLAVINWQTAYATKNDATHVARSTEYVLVYAKNEKRAVTGLTERTDEMDARYSSPDSDPRAWMSGNASAPGAATHPGMVYAIQSPFTGELHYPPQGRCWTFEKPTIKRYLEEWGSPYEAKSLKDGKSPALVLASPLAEARERAKARLAEGRWPRLIFTKGGDGGPRVKNYLEEVKQGKVTDTYWARAGDATEVLVLDDTSWDHEQSGHSQDATKALNAIVGGENVNGMTGVKPLKLIRKVIQIWCPPGGVVLDPFAGSGTTGDAVLRLNKENEDTEGFETLSFVLIERGAPEKGDEYCQSLTQDRLRRVITGDWADGKAGAKAGGATGGEFKYLRLTDIINERAILAADRERMVELVTAAHLGDKDFEPLEAFAGEDYKYLIGRNRTTNEGIYLVWSGAEDAAATSIITEEIDEEIALERERAALTPRHHVYACTFAFQSDDVEFRQIPNALLLKFGLAEDEGYAS